MSFGENAEKWLMYAVGKHMAKGKIGLWSVQDLELIVKWFTHNLTMFTGDDLNCTVFAFEMLQDYIEQYVEVHACGLMF